MKDSRKQIQELTIRLDNDRNELNHLYSKFGEKLFNDSSDPTTLSGAIPEEVFGQWRSIRTERDFNSQAVLDIKNALSRQEELERFKKELKKQIAEENTYYLEHLSTLGGLIINTISDKDLESLDFFTTRISQEKASIEQLEEKHKSLQEDVKNASFFKKILAQMKIVGFKTTLRQSKEKLDTIVAEETKKIVENDLFIKKKKTIEKYPTILAEFEIVLEIKEKLDTLIEREIDLAKDFSIVRSTLEHYNATTHSQNRIYSLKNTIKEADKKIDTILSTTARSYADNFLTEKGKSLLGTASEGNEFRDLGMYSHYLEQIGTLRKNIWIIRNNIEILETSIKVISLEKNIEDYSKSIEDYSKKIAQYQQQVLNLEKNIEKAKQEKEDLSEHKKSLENEIVEEDKEI